MAHLVAALLLDSRNIANNYIDGPFPAGVLALTQLQKLCARIGSVARSACRPPLTFAPLVGLWVEISLLRRFRTKSRRCARYHTCTICCSCSSYDVCLCTSI
jgi:hypothetical protein